MSGFRRRRALEVGEFVLGKASQKVTLEPSQKITKTKGPDKGHSRRKCSEVGINTGFFRGEWGMRRPDQAHVPVLCRGVIGVNLHGSMKHETRF